MEKNVQINPINSPTATAATLTRVITSMSFADLEENINNWKKELEEQELIFFEQVMQLNARDQQLFANKEKIEQLNNAIVAAKDEQRHFEYELNFMLAEQKALEELLAPMEKLLDEPRDTTYNCERENMYFLVENLETQIRQMSEDLKEVIEHINQINRSQDINNPIVQIGRILDAHMSTMQWIDNTITQISIKLDQLYASFNYLAKQ